jgi:GT2 family glycosyltransferase
LQVVYSILDMVKIAIVILNWNRPELTLECLRSIENLDRNGVDLTVIVVDNASVDDSVKKLKKINLKNIKFELIENNDNFGFAKGNNIGIRHAMAHDVDFIVVLNNDTVLDKNILKEFIGETEKNMDAAVFSPKIYFAKGYEFHKGRYKKSDLGNVFWYAGGNIDWLNVQGLNRGVDAVDKGQFEKVQDLEFATGACMFIRASALVDHKAFDEKYFMYLEDADFSMRMRREGWKVIYVPKAKLWHKVAQSSGIGSDLNDYFITRNRLLFGFRYAPYRTKFALFRESVRFLAGGRKWQKLGVVDFYFGRFGMGSWGKPRSDEIL